MAGGCAAWRGAPGDRGTAAGGPPVVAAAAPPALVTEGERWWRRSPDPANLPACATCHHDPEATRGWAASFPKVRPMPPPHTRVMTLLQANAEAVWRHYRMADPLPIARTITAYLTAHGAGLPITPGAAAGQPVFPTRMEQLAASVRRGEATYARRCIRCHAVSAVTWSVTAFPRQPGGKAEILEIFLEGHHPIDEPLRWDGQPVADLLAYLAAHIVGKPGKPGPISRRRQASGPRD